MPPKPAPNWVIVKVDSQRVYQEFLARMLDGEDLGVGLGLPPAEQKHALTQDGHSQVLLFSHKPGDDNKLLGAHGLTLKQLGDKIARLTNDQLQKANSCRVALWTCTEDEIKNKRDMPWRRNVPPLYQSPGYFEAVAELSEGLGGASSSSAKAAGPTSSRRTRSATSGTNPTPPDMAPPPNKKFKARADPASSDASTAQAGSTAASGAAGQAATADPATSTSNPAPIDPALAKTAPLDPALVDPASAQTASLDPAQLAAAASATAAAAATTTPDQFVIPASMVGLHESAMGGIYAIMATYAQHANEQVKAAEQAQADTAAELEDTTAQLKDTTAQLEERDGTLQEKKSENEALRNTTKALSKQLDEAERDKKRMRVSHLQRAKERREILDAEIRELEEAEPKA